jgi:hypothetical protein
MTAAIPGSGVRARPVRRWGGRTPEERFWSYIMKGDGDLCWLWLGTSDKHGYGIASWRGTPRGAHRVSWAIANNGGELPLRPMIVCHRCDTTLCVRPDHLFLGTHLDNARDKVAKGRQASGTHSPGPNIKLTPAIVLEMIEAVRAGERPMDVSLRYGRPRSTVMNILRRRAWRHITEGMDLPEVPRGRAARSDR